MKNDNVESLDIKEIEQSGYFPELDAIPQLTVAQKVQLSREIKHPEEIPLRIKAYKQYEAKHVIRSPIGVLKDALGLNGKPAWEPNPDKPKSVSLVFLIDEWLNDNTNHDEKFWPIVQSHAEQEEK
jgi:hypothetical protein